MNHALPVNSNEESSKSIVRIDYAQTLVGGCMPVTVEFDSHLRTTHILPWIASLVPRVAQDDDHKDWGTWCPEPLPCNILTSWISSCFSTKYGTNPWIQQPVDTTTPSWFFVPQRVDSKSISDLCKKFDCTLAQWIAVALCTSIRSFLHHTNRSSVMARLGGAVLDQEGWKFSRIDVQNDRVLVMHDLKNQMRSSEWSCSQCSDELPGECAFALEYTNVHLDAEICALQNQSDWVCHNKIVKEKASAMWYVSLSTSDDSILQIRHQFCGPQFSACYNSLAESLIQNITS